MGERALTVPSQGQGQPIIVFQGLSDKQFDQVVALWQPKPATKHSLMTDPVVACRVGAVAGYLESRKYVQRDSNVFAEPIVVNHFDNIMTAQLKDQTKHFGVNEWFFQTRGKLPDAFQNYDPNEDENGDYQPAPEFKQLDVDWIGELLKQELENPGFIALFYNCIEMQKAMHTSMKSNMRAAGISTNPFEQHRPAPAPIFTNVQDYDLGPVDLLRAMHRS